MNNFTSYLRQLLFGKARNPFDQNMFRHTALIAVFAWVGLGSDSLSSACYGPEEAFLALGPYSHLALYIAIATVITVFVISLAYNQVIELFPSGGGGYKVATQLLGPLTGLISGAALIADYILTIALSFASGVDALFSLVDPIFLPYKLSVEIGITVIFTLLNLRGAKESIAILLPIFMGFVLIHVALILYGIFYHASVLPTVVNTTVQQTQNLSLKMGWIFLVALLIRSYSHGCGTYTGIEAVSNCVNQLAKPRVQTGKRAMLYLAVSLSFIAGGIILIYLLWDATPVIGQTLNAVVFHKILGDSSLGRLLLFLTLTFEAGLLFVGGNTGFLAGPSLLANMAADRWVPTRFRHLSSRLVTHQGVLMFGVATIALLVWSRGHVFTLVILQSMNVFLTFSLSILGICVYWWRNKQQTSERWLGRFIFSIFALLVTSSIFIIIVWTKFLAGGWVTLIVTGSIITLCLLIKKHYDNTEHKLEVIDTLLTAPTGEIKQHPISLDANKATAVILIGQHRGVGVHTLLWLLHKFPDRYKNFVFITAGIVDVESFNGKNALDAMQSKVQERLNYFVSYCHAQGLAATSYAVYGTDTAEQLAELSEKVSQEFPHSTFITSRLAFKFNNKIIRWFHNESAYSVQHRLHQRKIKLTILSMRI